MANNVIVTIKANASGFNAEMREVNTQLKVTDSNFKLLSTQAKLFGSNSSYLKAQQEQYANTLNGLNEKLTVQTSRMAQLEKSYSMLDVSMTENLSLQEELNAQKAAAIESFGAESEEVTALGLQINTLSSEYGVLSASMSKVKGDIAATTINMNRTQESMARTESSLNGVNAAFTTRHIDGFSKSMGTVSTVSGNVSRSLVPLSLGLGIIGGASAKASIDFGNSMAKLSTIADATQMPIGELRKSVLKLSNQTGTSASEIAESAYQAISAGRSTSDALKFVAQANKLATGGFTSNAEAVHTLSIIMNAYGLQANQTNMVSNELIRTQNLGITTVDQLGQSIGDVIPIASDAGVNLQQVCAGLVVLTRKGHDTAKSTTELKSMFNEISKSGSKSDKVLRKLTGTGFEGLMKKGDSVTDVLKILNTYAAKNGKTLKDMFGNIRAGSGALGLMANNGTEFNSALKSMQKQGNDTNVAFEKMANTAGFKLKKSLNELRNAGIQIGGALAPVISTITSKLTSLAIMIQSLSPKQLKMITDIGLGVIAFTLFAGVLSKVAGGLSLLGKGVSKTVGFFLKGESGVSSFSKLIKGTGSIFKKTGSVIAKASKGILKSVTFVGKGVVKSFSLMKTGVLKSAGLISKGSIKAFALMKTGILKSASAIATGAVKSFGAIKTGVSIAASGIATGIKAMGSGIASGARMAIGALKTVWGVMMANPITVVIALIALIGVALYEAYQHCTWFRKAINDVWKDITQVFTNFINFLCDVFEGKFTGAIGLLVIPLQLFMRNVVTIWNGIKGVFNGIIEFIKGVFTGNWSEAWSGIVQIFSSIFGTVTGIAQNILGSIKSAFDDTIGWISNKISYITNLAGSIGHTVTHAISSVFMAIPNKPITTNVKHSNSFAKMPQAQSFASFAVSNSQSLGQVSQGIGTLSQSSNQISQQLNIELIAVKVADRISSVILKNENNKYIQTSINIDGKKVATATSKPLNRLNGTNLNLNNRQRGLVNV